MNLHLVGVLAAALTVAQPGMPTQPGWSLQTSDATARALLERARSSLGGPERLGGIHTIVVHARHVTSYRGVNSSGEFTFWAHSPDAVRIDTGFEPATQVSATDGTSYSTGDIKRGVYAPRRVDTPEALQRGRLMMLRRGSRLLTAWLLNAPRGIAATASDAGRWTWQGGAAESVSVTGGGDGFTVGRVGFDGKTGLPCRLGFASHQGLPTTAPPGTVAPGTNEEWELLDYRAVDGLRLAHRIVMREDGVVYREILVTSFEINPTLAAGAFRPTVGR
jgi:hypothetical protein